MIIDSTWYNLLSEKRARSFLARFLHPAQNFEDNCRFS